MNIKPFGIALIVIGILMIAYTSFNFITTEKIVDLGPIEITKQNNHPMQWSPFIGVAILIGGVVMVLSSKNKSV
ncbi:MAG: hypothetical protein V4683_01305 [Bacteroidota bacterium]